MTQNIEQRTLAATNTMEGAAKTVDEIAHQDKDVQTPVGTRKSFPKIAREADESFIKQSIDHEKEFQSRWSVSQQTIPWSAGLNVADRLQRYHVGTLGTESYKEYLPSADKLPFQTGASILEDLQSGYWIENGVPSKHWTESTTREGDELSLGLYNKIFRGSNGRYAQIGDEVPFGTTHVAVYSQGNIKLSRLSKKISGVLSDIGDYHVDFDGNRVRTTNISYAIGQVYVTDEGAVDDPDIDSYAAISATLDRYRNSIIQVVFSGDFRVTNTLDFSKCHVLSKGATIHKDHDGLGVLIDGDVVYTYITGTLFIDGYGAYKATGYEASKNLNAVGMQISGRCIINGKVLCRYHDGHGHFIFNNNKNMNKCTLDSLWSLWCNGYGHKFSGTRDDCSVWNVKTYSQYCYLGGQYVDDDFSGRQWTWFCYNEGTTDKNAPYGVYIGGLRGSSIHIYSEEQTALSADAIHISESASYCDVVDFRSYRTVNKSPTTIIRSGAIKYYYGDAENEVDSIICPNLTQNVNKSVAKVIKGSGHEVLYKDIINGVGGFKRRAQNRSAANIFTALGALYTGAFVESHKDNGRADLFIDSYRGVPDAPKTLLSGNLFSQVSGRACVDDLSLATGYYIRGRVIGDPMNGGLSTNLEFGVSGASSLASTRMTLQNDGVLNVPAGITPFTGMHVGLSNTELKVGYAVDVIDVIDRTAYFYEDVLDEDGELIDQIIAHQYTEKVPLVAHSTVEQSKVCAGIVDAIIKRDDGMYDVHIAAVGDVSTINLNGFLVCDEGGEIEQGDLLCTSNIEGHLMKCPEGVSDSVVKFKSMQAASFINSRGAVYGYFK